MQRGSCDKYLTWTLDDDGILIISGEGHMNDYRYDSPQYKIQSKFFGGERHATRLMRQIFDVDA